MVSWLDRWHDEPTLPLPLGMEWVFCEHCLEQLARDIGAAEWEILLLRHPNRLVDDGVWKQQQHLIEEEPW